MNTQQIIPRIALTIAIVAIVAYAAFRVFGLTSGPEITIFHPADGMTVAEEYIDLIVETERAEQLTINGRIVDLDQNGKINERLYLTRGPHRFEIIATDRYGSEQKTALFVVKK